MKERTLPGMVPCGRCTLCCQRELLYVHPELGDDPEDYETQEIDAGEGETVLALAQKPNGDCIYLERHKGCTIHDKRPAVCKKFDCRVQYAITNNKDRRYFIGRGMMSKEVFDQGRRLLKTLIVTADIGYRIPAQKRKQIGK